MSAGCRRLLLLLLLIFSAENLRLSSSCSSSHSQSKLGVAAAAAPPPLASAHPSTISCSGYSSSAGLRSFCMREKGRKDLKTGSMRLKPLRIRLVCDDPEATDSDSDDEYQTSINSTTTSRQKRIVVDIRIPDSPVLSGADVSSQDSSALPRKPCKIAQSKKLPSIKPLTTASLGNKNKMRGVRQRRWGKWAAEIRDPIRGRRLWLGTYDTAEEASIAYRNAALSIEAEKNALSLNNHRQKNKVICSSTSTSVSTSDDSEAQNRFSLSSPSSVLALAKPVNDAKMTTSAALTIPITTATRAVASSPAEDKVSAAATTQPGVLEQGEEDLFIPFDQEYLGIINMDLGSELDGLLMEDDLGQIVGDLAEMEDVSLSGFDDKLYGGFDNIDPSGWIDA